MLIINKESNWTGGLNPGPPKQNDEKADALIVMLWLLKRMHLSGPCIHAYSTLWELIMSSQTNPNFTAP